MYIDFVPRWHVLKLMYTECEGDTKPKENDKIIWNQDEGKIQTKIYTNALVPISLFAITRALMLVGELKNNICFDNWNIYTLYATFNLKTDIWGAEYIKEVLKWNACIQIRAIWRIDNQNCKPDRLFTILGVYPPGGWK